jgi:RHS repeat-associated protein
MQTAGRFVSEDPIGIGGGTNIYTFAGDDPIDGDGSPY